MLPRLSRYLAADADAAAARNCSTSTTSSMLETFEYRNQLNMQRKRLFVFLLLVYPSLLSAAKCRAAPKSLQNVQMCCPLPLPNWGAYNSECANSGLQPSCRLACIFNATAALQGQQQLNLTQVRPMLERAFTNPEIIDAYAGNFANCASLVHSKYQELARLSRQSDACDRHALFYSLCAHSRLMRRCPAAVWQRGNKKCQEASTYIKNCAWPALKMFMKST